MLEAKYLKKEKQLVVKSNSAQVQEVQEPSLAESEYPSLKNKENKR